jgi:S-(hydroxymethyl)glutathione dehydrogenase/alcohol dehydrogenase
MKAVILEQYNKPLVVDDVEILPLASHDVLVEIGASGVCHSDLSASRGQYPFTLPIVLGHEGAGIVTDVGSDVSTLKRGDRVIASWVSFCGRCYQCVRGRGHLCETSGSLATIPHVRRNGKEFYAMTGLGTMAETMTVNEASLIRIETELPDEQLALLGCGVTTGVGAALWTARVEPGTSVAIFGCGGVGLSAVQGASIAGASQIIVVDPLPMKRDAALSFGATDAVDPAAGDPVEQIRSLTGGRGVEYSFEVVGLLQTMRQAFDAACMGGTVTFVGGLRQDVDIALPANALHAQAKRILGSVYGSAQVRRHIPRLVALAEAGRLDLGGMVTRRVTLDDVNDAIDAIEAGEVIRSVLVPNL